MIEIKNLSLDINNKKILNDINLLLGDNKIIVLLGENGSGKSTLFNSMLDIKKNRYQGSILVDGKNIKEMNAKDISKMVTINFQVKPTIDAYVYEMLELARAPFKGLSIRLSKDEENRIEYAIELTNIEKFLDRRMDTLSGGERQMVYLAMSIIQNTPYIFLDEPNTYLDIDNQHRLINILKVLKEEGHTIVISLHSIETAFNIADIIYVMKNGTILGSINKEDFFTEHLIESTFNVEKIIVDNNNEKLFIFR